MNIKCKFCEKDIEVSECDFGRWCQGEVIYCEECYLDWKNDVSKTIRY